LQHLHTKTDRRGSAVQGLILNVRLYICYGQALQWFFFRYFAISVTAQAMLKLILVYTGDKQLPFSGVSKLPLSVHDFWISLFRLYWVPSIYRLYPQMLRSISGTEWRWRWACTAWNTGWL